MTTQFGNDIFIDGERMQFAGIEGDGFPIPKSFNIETLGCSSGCGRGYVMK